MSRPLLEHPPLAWLAALLAIAMIAGACRLVCWLAAQRHASLAAAAAAEADSCPLCTGPRTDPDTGFQPAGSHCVQCQYALDAQAYDRAIKAKSTRKPGT